MENKQNNSNQSNSNRNNMQSGNQSNQNQGSSGGSNMGGTSGKGGMGNITSKLQEFGSATVQKMGNLTTTQKIVGGSLIALGAGWITMSMSKRDKQELKSKAGEVLSEVKNVAKENMNNS